MKRSKKAWVLVRQDTGNIVGCASDDEWKEKESPVYLAHRDAVDSKWTDERVKPCVITWDDGKPAPRKRGARRASR